MRTDGQSVNSSELSGNHGSRDTHRMTLDERAKIAAVCIVRATNNRRPVAVNPSRFWWIVLVHRGWYRTGLKFLALVHVLLTLYETPPKLLSASSAKIEAAGYWVGKAFAVDGTICLMYTIHMILLMYISPIVEREKTKLRIVDKNRFVLLVIVMLLVVDFFWGLGKPESRPLRALRPGVFVMLSDRMQYFVFSCLLTFGPLLKAFMLIMLALCFYTVVVLSLFQGEMSNSNIFGAACLTLSGSEHPFKNFGYAFLNMYALLTGDAHPQLVWPFLSCNCAFTSYVSFNTTIVELENNCGMRRATATFVFVSFIVMVFFCLGAAILAVCYHFFEQISRTHIIHRILRQRFGLLAAHHYLKDPETHMVEKDAFVLCLKHVQTMKGSSSKFSVDKFWELLDHDQSSGLSHGEFFALPDLLNTSLRYKTASDRFDWYTKWKSTTWRHKLLGLLHTKTPGLKQINAIDFVMLVLVLVNALLASIQSTRGSVQSRYADYTTGVFVIEVCLKMSGYGVGTYWLDWWNRFDFLVTLLSVLVVPIAQSGAATSLGALLKLVPCIRLMRLMKVLSILQSSDDAESYYKKLLNSLATTVPVCLEALLLLFFYVYVFAIFGMIILGKDDLNTRVVNMKEGFIDFRYKNSYGYDWADMVASLWSALAIIVGNTWSTYMFDAVDKRGLGLGFFFIAAHFFGVFLLLNIIQSVFVFAFSMLLDESMLMTTLEWHTRRHLLHIANQSDKELKQMSRQSNLDYLMTTPQDVDEAYTAWVASQRKASVMSRSPWIHSQQVIPEEFVISFTETFVESDTLSPLVVRASVNRVPTTDSQNSTPATTPRVDRRHSTSLRTQLSPNGRRSPGVPNSAQAPKRHQWTNETSDRNQTDQIGRRKKRRGSGGDQNATPKADWA